MSDTINIYHAILSVNLAERIIQAGQCDVAIITPYKAQVRLINKYLGERKELKRKVRVGTVHKFQGGESDVIIFDTTDGFGASEVSKLLDDTKDNTAKFLLNVALTRAKCKVILIANVKFIEEKLPVDSKILKVIRIFKQRGETISSERFVESYFARDFEQHLREIIKIGTEEAPSILYREREFYPIFFRDLINAKRRVIIVSPFISQQRLSDFIEIFKMLRNKGIEVKIYTRPLEQIDKKISLNIEKAIVLLRSMGINVIERSRIHYKVAIIDDHIVWEGSLNILSHRDTKEQMRRFESKAVVEEVLQKLVLK